MIIAYYLLGGVAIIALANIMLSYAEKREAEYREREIIKSILRRES